VSEEKPVYDVRQAQAAIEADRQWRTEEAARRIQPILDELRCHIDAVAQLTQDGRIAVFPRMVAD
jgi:hypothetical protein